MSRDVRQAQARPAQGPPRDEPADGRPARARRSARSWSTRASPSTCRSPTASASTRSSSTPTTIRPNSPVRIAGVNIGKVKKVKAYKGGDGNMSLVTMEIDEAGPADPQGRDAEDPARASSWRATSSSTCTPGTPSAPTIDDGDTLPVTQTAAPVQFDQILTALQSDTREDLKRLLEGYGTALTYEPTGRRRRGAGPRRPGQDRRPVAQRRSIDYAPGALRERRDRQRRVPRPAAPRPLRAGRQHRPRSPRRCRPTRTR